LSVNTFAFGGTQMDSQHMVSRDTRDARSEHRHEATPVSASRESHPARHSATVNAPWVRIGAHRPRHARED
jgi:hypothetical protein